MPTPFYHLSLAWDLRFSANFPAILLDEWPAFCLGNIAPDAQTLSGQTREATHFFAVPMRDPTPAWEFMFRQHPELATPGQLSPARAAFLSGYLCHLALDQLWIAQIFDPVFGEEADWGTFRERLFLHNVMRIYLDRLDLPRLKDGMGETLALARPEGWLPFLEDEFIARWRDFVGEQLTDKADSQTVAVFAARMGLAPTEFESLLQSSADMQARLFDRLPVAVLADFRSAGLDRCRVVLSDYLSGQKG
jgi:hypothetical protein